MRNKITIGESSMARRVMKVLYTIIAVALTVYSYALVDLNFTLFNNSLWAKFREIIIQIGYFNRNISFTIYFLLLTIFFILHFLVINKKSISPVKIAFLIGFILLFSYPFLSHDFFNYMFDAKILTYYHLNPYFYRALDFPYDQWTRFMHWTHRVYPYGPVFLIISLVPSFLGMGKLVLHFFLLKGVFVFFYILATYVLQKMNKKWALFFATHPLILIEGIVSSHNDLIAASLGIIGIYFLFSRQNILSRIFFLLSGGIKYLTLPLVLLTKKNKIVNWIVLMAIIAGSVYASVKLEVQPWYFINLFVFLPYFDTFLYHLQIFFIGLLVSYYPYIVLGGWDTVEKVILKRQIIMIFLFLNLIYLLVLFLRRSKIQFFKR